MPLRGDQIIQHLDALAELRIRVFRDWPYLYDGDKAYEREYLRTYAAAPTSLCVLALDGDRPVGAATAVALDDEDRAFGQGLASAGYPREAVYYFGESVLLPEYRRRGIGVGFFHHREAEASRQGKRWCAFCGVVRPADHPLRPASYTPLDNFWGHRGYEKAEGVMAEFNWKDIDQPVETTKPLQFWIKEISPA
jgi:GNAT superfamily N-acetyltransferase